MLAYLDEFILIALAHFFAVAAQALTLLLC